MVRTATTYNRRRFLQSAGSAAATAALLGSGANIAHAASAVPTVIEFWNPNTDPIGHKQFDELCAQFSRTVGKAHNFRVVNRVVPDTDNSIRYTTAMTSTGSPDCIMTYSYDHLASWAANGFIQPLDAYFNALGFRQSDFLPITWDMIHFVGHVWGLLQEFDLYQLFWNKAIHHGDPPRTIAELDALAATYTRFDHQGNLVQAGMIPWAFGSIFDWAAVFGGGFYDHKQLKWTINTATNREVLEWMLKYVHMLGGRSKADAAISTANAAFSGDLFWAGKVAFALEGEWVPRLLVAEKITGLTYGVAHTPTRPGIPYGTAATQGGNALLLPAKSPHPKEAAMFLQFMASPAVVLKVDLGDVLPPTPKALYSPVFEKSEPALKPFIEAVRFNHIAPPIPSPVLPVFEQEISTAVDAVTFKKKTPAQALADVESKMLAQVHQFKQFHPTWPGE